MWRSLYKRVDRFDDSTNEKTIRVELQQGPHNPRLDLRATAAWRGLWF